MLLLLACSAFLLGIIYYCLRWMHWYKCVWAIPGPSTWTYLRILFFCQMNSPAGLWDFMKNTVGAYDGICRTQVGLTVAIVVWDPAHLETVFTSRQTTMKHQVYDWFMSIAAKGVVTENGPTWKELRKGVNQGMKKRLVDTEVQTVFIRETNAVLESVKDSHSRSNKFDMVKLLAPIMVNSFSETQLGVSSEETAFCKDIFIDTVYKMSDNFLPFWIKYSYLWKTIFKMTRGSSWLERNRKQLHDYPEWIIEKRLPLIEDRARHKHDTICFTDLVIKRAEEYGHSKDQMNLEMTDFMIAGAETTLKTTAAGLVLISQHPDVQEKLFQEQFAIFGDSKREPTTADLAEMNYLGMVIKETLRHVCPINIFRQVSDDIKLGEYTIPQGSLIVISLALLHRLPKYWEHPDKFYPDHFLPEKESARPKYAYCPFSMGQRSCPGFYYAVCLMKIIISKVIRSYRLSTDLKYEDIVWEYSFMLDISKGYPVKFEERKAVS